MTVTREHMRSTSPMLWLMKTMLRPRCTRSSSSRSRMRASTVTSSAVVGSSSSSKSGEQASAVAITMRCFMPPDNWCG
ncbi:Protein of uncharacterised function (DUF1602) [Bordetella pertussis]|nr:Protein of uncharacterised function (DUF1602) [Bordetella pertussis]CFM53617.1 Protein of uncharacterised function (DUF1602) [Bordetella pertussis]CFN55676.1 Protein of uncharacterised function (DUF1602) [Bordetella pertussis]CFN72407.1 Protein of uncharacterised function (DUF1602) [Bordetella pertussis]CFO04276.1 Protein of uncharacterised function (DUF1602) [Bordetella pertussis]